MKTIDKLKTAEKLILDICKEYGLTIEDGFDGGFVILLRDNETDASIELSNDNINQR